MKIREEEEKQNTFAGFVALVIFAAIMTAWIFGNNEEISALLGI